MDELDFFFSPRRIAVVGASPGKSGFANLALRNLAAHPHDLSVVAIHPHHSRVDEVPAVPSLTALASAPPELCIIGVRADLAPSLVRECGTIGVRAAVVLASGFGETGTVEGRALEAEIRALGREFRVRIIGPNAMGVARFGVGPVSIASGNIPSDVRSGGIAIVSQSGGISTTFLRRGLEMGLGFSHMATLGNELDVGMPEVIEHLAGKPEVRGILAYVEAIRDPAAFRGALEKAAGLGKPVILLKGGQTAQGARATASHTGALAADAAVWGSAVRQFGGIEAWSLDHAIATALLFSRFGLAPGNAIGGFGTGGGAMVLLSDMLAQAGVRMPDFAPGTAEVITARLPDLAANNPFEMGGKFLSDEAKGLATALAAVAADPNIDLLVFMVLPMAHERASMLCGALVKATRGLSLPIIVLSYDARRPDSFTNMALEPGEFLIIDPPETGAAALKSWVQFEPMPKRRPRVEGNLDRQEAVRRRLRESAGRAVLEVEGKAILGLYGLKSPEEILIETEDEAAEAAKRIGFPLALKIISVEMPHRGVGRGVLLDLGSEAELRDGFRRLQSTSAAFTDAKILLQRMTRSGREFLIGAVRDPSMGLAMAIGQGGAEAERHRDAVLCVPPISRADLRRRLADWPALGAERESDDLEALLDAAEAVEHFLGEAGDLLDELDVNPVIVTEDGAVIVDALMILSKRDDADHAS